MPPKKRGRPAATEAPPEPEFEPIASNDENENDGASDRSDQDANSDPSLDIDERESDFKFFNTTFSTFRVSPLHIAQNPLTPVGFETLSRRLRDTLVGDVVRGVQVGLEGDGTGALGRLGVLERVEWRECGLESILPGFARRRREGGEDDDEDGRNRRRGGGTRKGKGPRKLLCLELEYENATFSALMLPALDDAEDEGHGHGVQQSQGHPGWTQQHPESRSKGKGIDTGRGTEEDEDEENIYAHFPLLLTRMPAPLKAVIVDFLASTFDCRISTLHIGTRTLVRSWERWIEGSGLGEGRKTLRKDLALTLGFHLEPPRDERRARESGEGDHEHDGTKTGDAPIALGLKTIDVIVPAEEVRRFLRIGRRSLDDARKGQGIKRSAHPTASTYDEEGEEEKERRRRRRLGGGRDEEGWAWRATSPRRHRLATEESIDETDSNTTETISQPFTDALAIYLNHHLALDIFHPGIRVLRVVCDAFALSEGRVKIFQPPSLATTNKTTMGITTDRYHGGRDGVETFLTDLIHRAQGNKWGEAAVRLAALR